MKILRGDIDGPAAMNEPSALLPSADQEIPVMPPKVRPAHRHPQDRKSMLDRAIRLVEQARRNGTTLDIDVETEKLLHENPNCSMSFAELRADFEIVASGTPSFLASLGER
jgi:hypothetical protein